MTTPLTGTVTPQSLVEHGVATSTADDCIVIVNDKTSANLRWANNTLTTNGVMHAISVTVISFIKVPGADGGVSTGSVTGSATSQSQVDALVRAADAAARAGSPAEDANDLVRDRTTADWDDQPVPTDIHVYDTFAPALGEAFGRAAAADRVLYGFVNHEMTTTYLGSTTGLRLRHVQPNGHYGCTGKTSDLKESAWVGGSTRDFTDVDALAMDATLAQRLGWGARRVDLPAGRYDTILPPTAMADLMIDAYWYAGARVAWEGQSVYSRRPTGTRIGETITAPGVNLFSDPAYDGLQCEPFNVAAASGNESSVFDNGLPLERTDWIRDGELTALTQTRHSAAMTSQPVTPAIDNLILSVDGATGIDRRPGGRHRARPAADLPLVHPRGRPADPAADRPHPRRGLPRRRRRDHRLGQQLPVQREPDRPAAPLQPRLGHREELQPRVGRRLLLPHRHASPAGARLQHVERQPGDVSSLDLGVLLGGHGIDRHEGQQGEDHQEDQGPAADDER